MTLLGVVVALAFALGGLTALRGAGRRWTAASAALVERLRAGAVASRATTIPTAFAPAELAGLPAPVARYLGAVLPPGQRPIRHARVTWAGEFNLGRPGAERWVRFTAVQDFEPEAPGFVWDARMAMVPGVEVWVRDRLVAGEAEMRGAVAALVPVVKVRGTAPLASAALVRYLGETVWLPTALLPASGVRWEALEADAARATLAAGATTVSLDFRFGADGLVTSLFASERSFDDGKHPPEPRPWRARILAWEERHGVTVPSEAVAEWLLPQGAFPYWKGRVLGVDYELA
ncbi:MAG: hypothetical protein IPK07_13825 [Deltaproteobacteria bacterium]|nr:hypothetical protein [Deltaproteobacteria bacterium]